MIVLDGNHVLKHGCHKKQLADLATEQNVSWRLRAQIKKLGWPMTERQIGHRKSSLVLSARFPVVKWRSRSVAKSA